MENQKLLSDFKINFSKLSNDELSQIEDIFMRNGGFDAIPRDLIKLVKQKFNLYLPNVKKNHSNFYWDIINETFQMPKYYINHMDEIHFEEITVSDN